MAKKIKMVAVLLIAGMLVVGMTFYVDYLQNRQPEPPAAEDYLKVLEKGITMTSTPIYDVSIEEYHITYGFMIEDAVITVFSESDLINMVSDGKFDSMERLTAVYDGASAIVTGEGGAVSLGISGKYRYAALGYCEGVYLLLEADGPTDFPELM